MPLSFSTITTGVSSPPAFSSASKLTPPVIAPSPTTATTRPSGSSPSAVMPKLAPLSHRLLDADRVARRGRGVPRAHDVVRRLLARAERREAAVLADRRQLLAAAGQHLVRIGLVADVPEDLVARRVEHAVQRDGQLARAEVRAEVAADLPDRVDDVLAHLLRELLELRPRRAPSGRPGRRCDRAELGHRIYAFLAYMKSVSSSRSEASPASSCRAASSAAARPLVRARRQLARPRRGRRRSRRCACRGARRCRMPCPSPPRSLSRRGCRPRSGTTARAPARSGRVRPWPARERPAGAARRRRSRRSAARSSGSASGAGSPRRGPHRPRRRRTGRRPSRPRRSRRRSRAPRRARARRRPPGARGSAGRPRPSGRRPRGSPRSRRARCGTSAVRGAGRRRPSPAGRRGSRSRCARARSRRPWAAPPPAGRPPRAPWRARAPGGCACRRPAASTASPRSRPSVAGPAENRRDAT